MTDKELRVEINRLQIAKRAALKIADERSKENVLLRKALEAILDASNDPYEIARAALVSQAHRGDV